MSGSVTKEQIDKAKKINLNDSPCLLFCKNKTKEECR